MPRAIRHVCNNTKGWRMTHDELLAKIEALKSPKGGWSKESLKSLGVSWPPKRGWKNKLLSQTIEKDKQ
jgi:hypothetical protein